MGFSSVLVLAVAVTFFLFSVVMRCGVRRTSQVRAVSAGSSDRWQVRTASALSVEEAHVVMQRHRHCGADTCSRKRAAFCVLIEAGHAVPDVRAERYLAATAGRWAWR